MRKRCLGKINLTDPENPKIDLINRNGFLNEIKDFRDGARIWMVVETYYKQRTPKQNGLMHAYMQEIADQSKMSLETVKRALKAQFLTVSVLDEDDNPVVNPATGEPLTEVRETSDLNTVECMEFCENIRLFAMDFGIFLKEPGEQEELKFTGLE